MAIDLLGTALAFLDQYGLVAVFILLVLDGAMLMPVLPGEAVMIMAVARYAHDLNDLFFLIGLTTAAGIVGSLILYTIARVGGRPLIEAHPRLFMMDRRRRESLEETFEGGLGQTLVLFLRVIPLTRIIVNIPAGLARMGIGRFVVYSSIGMAAFHSGFLWLAYEYNQPESAVARQATTLQETYATPAMDYLQTNEIVAGGLALAIGAYISFRSSRRMLKYPEGAITSVIGWLTARVLLFGAIGLWAVTWYEPQLVYQAALAGGLDLKRLAARAALEPARMIAYVSGIAGSIGLILVGMDRWARRRKARAEAAEEAEQAEEDEQIKKAAVEDLDGEESGSGEGEPRFEDVGS